MISIDDNAPSDLEAHSSNNLPINIDIHGRVVQIFRRHLFLLRCYRIPHRRPCRRHRYCSGSLRLLLTELYRSIHDEKMTDEEVHPWENYSSFSSSSDVIESLTGGLVVVIVTAAAVFGYC
eukprot:scaffold30608_cov52-Cyclotella_meneghiniana.AAC.2